MKNMNTIRDIPRKVWAWLLDTIAPQDPQIEAIHKMGKEGFTRLLSVRETNGVISFFPYKNEIVKAALLELKTHHTSEMAGIVGSSLYEALARRMREEPLEKPALLFPLPITKKKRRARGWNQCDLIVEAIGNTDSKAAGETSALLEVRTDILIKHRDTDDQVGKDRTERFKNVANTCRVEKPDAVRGRTVIVIDDIVTTGATLQEAKRALTEAGVGKVILMSVAY